MDKHQARRKDKKQSYGKIVRELESGSYCIFEFESFEEVRAPE
jgi:hypothetical protein